MELLRDLVHAERNRLFVGRRTEMEHLTAWLAGPPAPTQVIAISGMGGIGKSTLLLEILRTAAAQGAVTLWLDGRACTRSPAGFLDYLETALAVGLNDPSAPPCPGDPVARLVTLVAGGRRTVLGIDNFDDLAVIEGWLREDFIVRLPARGVLLLLASRQGVSHTWQTDPAWRQRLVHWSLPPLGRAEAREYLGRLGLDTGTAGETLIREAGGHPLALALGAELLERRPLAPSPSMSQAISAHLLREVATPDLHPLLEALAILLEGDQELLSRVLGEAVAPDRYHAMTRLSFLRPSAHGLALHDVARAHLLADLRRRAPGRCQLLRRRALAALRARLAAATGRQERRAITAGLLNLCTDALPVHDWVADLTVISDLPAPIPARPEERRLLHGFLKQWAAQAMGLTELEDDHRLLDALIDRFPESVWVCHSPEGEPFGFYANVLLHRETAALLEGFRAGALHLKNCPPEERAALDCRPEEADTYYGVLSGLDVDGTGYAVKEVVGALLQDLLGLLGVGTRLLIMASNPELHALFQRLGFRLRPDCRVTFDDAPWPFQVAELDFRRGDFGAWADSLLGAVEQGNPADGPPVTMEEARTALAVIEYPSRLEESNLARRLGLSGRGLHELLRGLLTTDAPRAPLTAAHQVVLRTTYLGGEQAPDTAAAGLNVSRSTYYRRLRAALEALAEALRQTDG